MKGETMTEFERYIQQRNIKMKYNNGGDAIDNYIKYKIRNRNINLVPLLNNHKTMEHITTAIEKELIKQIQKAFDKKK